MGKTKLSESNQETPSSVFEIIYSDADLITSFDSQYNNGATTSYEAEEAQERETLGTVEGKLFILDLEGTGRLANQRSISRQISPHDSKIIELIEYLNITKTKETFESNTPSFVHFEGRMQFLMFPIMKCFLTSVFLKIF